MSHSFQVPDDLYTELATYAARRGQSPDVLLMESVPLIAAMRNLAGLSGTMNFLLVGEYMADAIVNPW